MAAQNTAFFSGLLMRILLETPTFLEAASNESRYFGSNKAFYFHNFGTALTVTKDPTSELTAATRDDTKRNYSAHHSVGATKIPDFNEIYLAYQRAAEYYSRKQPPSKTYQCEQLLLHIERPDALPSRLCLRSPPLTTRRTILVGCFVLIALLSILTIGSPHQEKEAEKEK